MATEPARNTEDKTSTLFQGSKFEFYSKMSKSKGLRHFTASLCKANIC